MPKIRLHGYPISNYYNRIKLALKIKELEFEEVRAAPAKSGPYLEINPLGVIPTLEYAGVYYCETQPIMEFLEEAFPDATPLLPKSPRERQNLRAIINIIDIHLDRPGRFLRDYKNSGNEITESMRAQVLMDMNRGIYALNKMIVYKPYINSTTITMADCAAFCSIPLLEKFVLKTTGENPLPKLNGFQEYMSFMMRNPTYAEILETEARQNKILERARKIEKARQ